MKCLHCGEEFEIRKHGQTYCNKKCRVAAKVLRQSWPQSQEARTITTLVNAPSVNLSLWDLNQIGPITPHIISSIAGIAQSPVVRPDLQLAAIKVLAHLDRLNLDKEKFVASRPTETPPLVTQDDLAAQKTALAKVFSEAPEIPS